MTLPAARKWRVCSRSAGIRCPLITSSDALTTLSGEEQAVVVGRKLLALPAHEAVADATATAKALLAAGAKQIYYKYSALFSSTARGNIGPIAEALRTLTKADYVLFCPARPANNATVYQGRLFLGQNMLHETPRRFDPVTPMTNSNLVEVLQSQSQVKTGLLQLRTLRSGCSQARRFLEEQSADNVKFFIVDAIDESDLKLIAALGHVAPFTTGSDDYPVALTNHWGVPPLAHEGRSLLPAAPGYTALLSGSCTPKSLRQLARFEERYPVYRIDLLHAAEADGYEEEITHWITQRIRRGPLAVATSADAATVKRVQAALSREGASKVAENLLSRLATRLYDWGVRKWLVAGGETSGKVLDTLGVNRLSVAVHDELLGGYCHTDGTDPMAFVLKAGATGDEDFYATALNRLQHADAARA